MSIRMEKNDGDAPQKPLTDPADLFRLLGRFGASVAAFFITLINFFMQRWMEGAIFAFVSLILQLWTLQLWRRLRNERIAAKAERAERRRGDADILAEEIV